MMITLDSWVRLMNWVYTDTSSDECHQIMYVTVSSYDFSIRYYASIFVFQVDVGVCYGLEWFSFF